MRRRDSLDADPLTVPVPVPVPTPAPVPDRLSPPVRAQGRGANPLVAGFWMGGFEGADHINAAGQALDMALASGHVDRLDEDFARAAAQGVTVVRESIGWRLAEPARGVYDLRRALRVQQAAARHGLQVLWTLMHYGLPDDLNLHDDGLIPRFAAFAAEVAATLGWHEGRDPVFTPINEIGFLAWCASQSGMLAPPNSSSAQADGSTASQRGGGADSATISGYAVKRRLVRAALAAMAAMRRVQPRARFMHVEPLVHVVAPPGRPDLDGHALVVASWQWQAWDMLVGRCEPELGGHPHMLDLLGVNHYHSSQWELETEERLRWHLHDSRRCPLHALLAQAWLRYGVPLVLAETSHVGVGRAAWLHDVASQVRHARANGVPVQGLCLYPLIDRPDWTDPGHWHRSGLWHVPSQSPTTRIIDPAYRAALHSWQAVLPADADTPVVPAPAVPGALPTAAAPLLQTPTVPQRSTGRQQPALLQPKQASGLTQVQARPQAQPGPQAQAQLQALTQPQSQTQPEAQPHAQAESHPHPHPHPHPNLHPQSPPAPAPAPAASRPSLPTRPVLLVLATAQWSDQPRRAQELALRLAGRWQVVYLEPVRPGAPSDVLHTVAAGPHVDLVVPHVRAAQTPQHLAAALCALWADTWPTKPAAVWMESPADWPLAQALMQSMAVCMLACDVAPPVPVADAPSPAPAPTPGAPAWLADWQAPCAQASLVLAAHPGIADHLRCAPGGAVHVLGAGVDLAAFSQHLPLGWDDEEAALLQPPQPLQPGLRVGFVGDIDTSVDLALLQALATLRPGWHWLLCGNLHGVLPAQLPRRPNLHWLREPPRRVVPALMRGWQVAMLPLRGAAPGAGAAGLAHVSDAADAPKAADRSDVPDVPGLSDVPAVQATPAVLHALASGLPVVSAARVAGLPAGGSAGALFDLASQASSFVQACEAAVCETSQRRSQRLQAAQAALAGRDWSQHADQVHGWLQGQLLSLPRAAARPASR